MNYTEDYGTILEEGVEVMLKVTLTDEILHTITQIEKNRFEIDTVKLPATVTNRLRKNSKKKSSYASNKIEGNPLTER